VLTGFAYVYMVAAWGGYVFVLNMIGIHAAALVVLGRYTSKLHRAYSLFFLIGTLGATRVPPVNLMPIKSLEQMGPLLVFVGLQLLEYVEVQRRNRRLSFLQARVAPLTHHHAPALAELAHWPPSTLYSPRPPAEVETLVDTGRGALPHSHRKAARTSF
jgi:dolichyl-diphosphooligosaccharide--protein glycosyltransferase